MHFILKYFSADGNELQVFLLSQMSSVGERTREQRSRIFTEHLSVCILRRMLHIVINIYISLNIFASFAVLST